MINFIKFSIHFLPFLTLTESVKNLAEQKLRSQILDTSKYSSDLEPPAQITEITICFKLLGIAGINDGEGKFNLQFELIQKWRDSRLSWKTCDNNIKSLKLKPTDVWLPQLVLGNAAHGDFSINQARFLNVNHDGIVDYRPGKIATTSCELDVDKFPLDTQTCAVKILPLFYSTDYVKFKFENPEYSLCESNEGAMNRRDYRVFL